MGMLDDYQRTLDGLHSGQIALEDPALWRLSHGTGTPAAVAPSSTFSTVVCGVCLTCHASVQVLTGPVVGRVTSSAALVLMEVAVSALVTCIAVECTLEHPSGVEVARCTLQLPAGQPRAFELTGLAPSRRHAVVFDGVKREDALAHVATFETAPLSPLAPLRLGVVHNGGAVQLLNHCAPPSAGWPTVLGEVASRRLQVLVHLGGQVSVSRLL